MDAKKLLVVGLAIAVSLLALERGGASAMPVHQPASRAKEMDTSIVHSYAMELYKCWNSAGSGAPMTADQKKSCKMATGSEKPSKTIVAAKSLRAILGISSQVNSTGELQLAFNVTSYTLAEVMTSVQLKLHKTASSVQVLQDALQQTDCPNPTVTLSLKAQLQHGGDFVTVSTNELSNVQLANDSWITFQNLTDALNCTAKMGGEKIFRLRLAANLTCNKAHVDIRELGFGTHVGTSRKSESLLVVYSSKKESLKSHMKKKATQSVLRERRQVLSSGDHINGRTLSCRLHEHKFNLSHMLPNNYEIPVGEIYSANVCHGHCEDPLPNTAKNNFHSRLQSIMNTATDGVTPSPCCVPSSYQQINVYVLHNVPGSMSYQTVTEDTGIATACSCL